MHRRYTREKILAIAEENIKKYNIYTIENLCLCLGISREHFYYLFREEGGLSDDLDIIKGYLDMQRWSLKKKRLDEIHSSDDKTLIIASMKLLGTNSERRRLATNYIDTVEDLDPENQKDSSIQEDDNNNVHEIRFTDMSTVPDEDEE